ncbi:MAG: right-handed parallel beta-helix repeat-containing protein [Chloroflexota bacterium]|nr:right-handed parallel beta-helix repeat-containing protein [Chloroflexota bacterium]
MNKPTESRDPGDIALALWLEQMAEVEEKPWLTSIMLEWGEWILSRLIQFYRRLRAQPRHTRRFLKARLKTNLAGVALLLALSITPVYAAVINVDGATCTLVDAITAANTDAAVGGCSAGSGADTIVLQPGSTHILTGVNNTVYGPSGLPVISSEITIEGNGATIERESGAPDFRILAVSNSGDLTLNEMTITGGKSDGVSNRGGTVTINECTISGNDTGVANAEPGTVEINNSTVSNNVWEGVSSSGDSGENPGENTLLTINNSTISGNTGIGVQSDSTTVEINHSTISGNSGSGVSSYQGPLTINNSTISGNAGGGVDAGGGGDPRSVIINGSTISGNTGGSGLFVGDAVTIDNSTISNNSGADDGAGIWIDGSSSTISNSTITGNTAAGEGGGLYIVEGDVTINNSTISGNSAYAGGGVYGMDAAINNSTITRNTATGGGGGLFLGGSGTINNSTISGNSAYTGGGVHHYFGDAAVNNSTITGNTANRGGGVYTYYGGISLNQCLISGNAAADGREAHGSGGMYADNYNLFGFDGDAGVTGLTLGPTDIVPEAGVQVSDILDTNLADNGGDTETHALVSGSPAVDAIPSAVCGVSTDQRGVSRPQGTDCDIGAFELEEVQNQPPTADADGPYTVPEGGSAPLDGSGSSDPDPGDTLTYEWDLDYDGVIFDVDATDLAPLFDAFNLDGPDSRTVALRVTDGAGAWDIETAAVTIDNVAPTVEEITAPIDPVEVGTPINVSASFTDPGLPDTHTAEWDWGDDTTSPGIVNGGIVTGSHTYAEPGVYTPRLTVIDDDGGTDEAIFQYVVVYDPSGGFVTGGGWINSPAGAYADDPSLTGKANFGFVSKYKKGTSEPTGQTEFQFKVADLNFHSDSYDWLVVAGPRAKYKGVGTINGSSNYGFMLTATDEALTPSTDVDLFRIKIWDKDNNDAIVYDNQMGEDDDSYAGTEIGGGNIKIHTK